MNQFPLIGLGLATTNKAGETLDTYFPKIAFNNAVNGDGDLFEAWSDLLDQGVCEITDLSTLKLSEKFFLSSLSELNKNSKLILCRITEDHAIESVEDWREVDFKMLRIGVMEYARYFVKMRQPDKADDIMNKVKQWYEDDETFMEEYNAIVNGE